jgi:polysaccharide export outer membrane protein
MRTVAILAAVWMVSAGAASGAAAQQRVTPETNPNTLAAPNGPARGAPVTKPSVDKSYRIGPEDVITVKVWNDGRLDGQVLVRPDGKISLNLVGEIMAENKTCPELEHEIGERLKASDIIKAPLVTVDVSQINSKKYIISGGVRNAGSFRLIQPITVVEAIANAGGFAEFANKKKIRIIRMTNGTFKEFKFNWNDVTKGKNIEQNIFLQAGDHIIVPD